MRCLRCVSAELCHAHAAPGAFTDTVRDARAAAQQAAHPGGISETSLHDTVCGIALSPLYLPPPPDMLMKLHKQGCSGEVFPDASAARLRSQQQPDCKQVTTPRLDSDCNSEFGGSPDNGTPPALQGIALSPFAGNSLEVLISCGQLPASSLHTASAGVGCCEPLMAMLLQADVTV